MVKNIHIIFTDGTTKEFGPEYKGRLLPNGWVMVRKETAIRDRARAANVVDTYFPTTAIFSIVLSGGEVDPQEKENWW